jgi:phosphatidylglycerophosphatase B
MEYPIGKVFKTALLFYALMLLPIGFFQLAFLGTDIHSIWVLPSYFITETAGKYGTIIILVLCAWFYGIRLEGFKNKVYSFTKSFLSLLLFFILFAYLNEHITKPLVSAERPSHLVIFSRSNWPNEAEHFYEKTKEERRLVLQEIISKNDSNFKDIHPLVKAHWIEESGFSFPSGHSFNSWMIAVVLSYSILQLRVRKSIRKYYWLPFLWAALVAISRVMLGAHTILDVSAGSLMGILVASGFLYFDKTRPLLFQKRG